MAPHTTPEHSVPTVRIPVPLRRLTGGAPLVEVAGHHVREVVLGLDARHPGIGERILDGDGELHRFVNVFVGEQDVRGREGLDTAVGRDEVVSIVPAVAGG